MLQKLIKANDGVHKYIAVFSDGKRVKFGAYGYTDFILSGGDKERRERYRARHKKDLETNNPQAPGYLSYYILWNKPSLRASMQDYNKRFF